MGALALIEAEIEMLNDGRAESDAPNGIRYTIACWQWARLAVEEAHIVEAAARRKEQPTP
jgi:hypothetical protein